jgi:hypothetical protein
LSNQANQPQIARIKKQKTNMCNHDRDMTFKSGLRLPDGPILGEDQMLNTKSTYKMVCVLSEM